MRESARSARRPAGEKEKEEEEEDAEVERQITHDQRSCELNQRKQAKPRILNPEP
jgi:hypothetical protein